MVLENIFSSIYTLETKIDISKCLIIIPECVSNDMNLSLTSEVTKNEVKLAVFNLVPHNAPSPDGLNRLFFRKSGILLKMLLKLSRTFS